MAVFTHGVRATAHRIAGLSPLLGRLPDRLSQLQRHYLSGQERHNRVLLGIQVLYACLFGGWFIYSKTWPAVDVVALFLLVFAFLAARGLSFLRDEIESPAIAARPAFAAGR